MKFAVMKFALGKNSLYIARPTTETVERISPPGVSSEDNNNQPKTPAEHHTILTPQQKNKQKTPTSSRPTHETEGHTKKIITITITHQDLNNNEQTNTGAILPIQQQTTQSSISTRKGCNGTLYRLSPMGRSNKPLQQKSTCHTHSQSTPLNATDSAWELVQTRDPQGIDNFRQNDDGTLSLTTQGKPRCNYCKLPNHGRQNCIFRLKDLQFNINRQTHPHKGNLTNTSTRNYVPDSGRGNRSPMSTRLANERDHSGKPRFWQTKCGYIIYSIDNQPQCSYCGIPSHGRDLCRRRHNDESRGLFRIHHPQRGLLQQTEYNKSKSPPNNTTRPPIPLTIQDIRDYQQTKHGEYILNSGGYRLCDYCGIPSHPRSQCKIRVTDVLNGIQRSVHPNRGQIPSRNQIRREVATIGNSTRKRAHDKQEDPHIPKTRPPHTHGGNNPINITMNDNQIPTTSAVRVNQVQVDLMDLPTETIHHIMKYLPF